MSCQPAQGEDAALIQYLFDQLAQLGVFDQLQAQQRSEDAKEIDLQGCRLHRAEGGGMYRHPATLRSW